MDYKELANELTKMLPKKIPYGELVGAPWPYTGQGELVYEEPEHYLMEQAATAIAELLERVERAERERDAYREMLYKERPCSLCQHYLPDWTPECFECARCSKEYRPRFELRHLKEE